MRQILPVIIILFTALVWSGCKKEEITLYNTQVTPDLSNPVIQKLTNVTWYRDGMNTVQEEWTTLLSIPKPSEAMASMLYSMAWLNMTLHRDGTSTMLYIPPVFPHVYIHCQGVWTVSTEEENTVIINTKTPVSSAIIKVKVLNLETRENVAVLNVSMDFGNRLLTAFMTNHIQDYRFDTFDEGWYANNPVSTTTINADEFIGAWASPRYDWENYHANEYPDENIVRSTHVDDLFSQTPNIFSGVKFTFEEEGKAYISYTKDYKKSLEIEKEWVSNASWSLKGNKIILESEEEFFYSAGELLFGFPINAPNLTYYGILKDSPIRSQSKRFYVFEVIKRENHGVWWRITSNDANFYTFLFKVDEKIENTTNIKDLVKSVE